MLLHTDRRTYQVLDTVVRDLKRVFQREEPNAAVDPNSAPLTISFLEVNHAVEQ